MNNKSLQPAVHKSLWQVLILVFAVVSFSFSIFIYQKYQADKKALITPEREQAASDTRKLALKYQELFERIAEVAQATRADLTAEQAIDREKILGIISRALHRNSTLIGVGVVYEPYHYDPDVRLFAPYIKRSSAGVETIQIENSYDYYDGDNIWFTDQQHQAHWNLPYYSLIAGDTVIEYQIDFTMTKNQMEQKGVIVFHLSIDDVLGDIAANNMGKYGYGLLLNEAGKLLSGGFGIEVDEKETATNIAKATAFPLLTTVSHLAMSGRPEHQSLIHKKVQPVEGADYLGNHLWGVVVFIPEVRWTLAMLYNHADIIQADPFLRQGMMWLGVSVAVFVNCVILLLLLNVRGDTVTRMGVGSFLVSLVFLMGTAHIWQLTFDEIGWQEQERTEILSNQDLGKLKKGRIIHALERKQPLPTFIPTGAFIQSVEFTSANNAVVTGYIWQKYSSHVDEKISRGVILPEAESTDLEPAYKREENGVTVYGWYFEIEVRQDFDYTRYPFDHQKIWIRMWHKDFDKNVVLVPDLEAYENVYPGRLPGVEKDFVLPGWILKSSFFNYRLNSYNTDFGINNYVGQDQFPELYFQVGIKRLFLNPFISNLTPVFVVFLMLFAVLITSSKKADKVELLGFNASTILASSSALFFVVLISHIELRSTLSANSIFYMEYFYIVAYLALLSVSINSILFSWNARMHFVQYQDNLLPKIYYWPVISLFIYMITLWKFYS